MVQSMKTKREERPEKMPRSATYIREKEANSQKIGSDHRRRVDCKMGCGKVRKLLATLLEGAAQARNLVTGSINNAENSGQEHIEFRDMVSKQKSKC